jgi:hypothetical protein
LKVTIGRREDWEMAVREADDSLKQTSEKRLQGIEPKVQFYTQKLGKNQLLSSDLSYIFFLQLFQKVNLVVDQKHPLQKLKNHRNLWEQHQH